MWHWYISVQERLLVKMGPSAHAFTFKLPTTAPSSIILQGSDETKAPVGIEYELVSYVSDSVGDRSHKRSSISMAIRKVSRKCQRIITLFIVFLRYQHTYVRLCAPIV